MSGKYAIGTSVSVEKSLAEIKAMLGKYGSKGFGYIGQERTAAIEFVVHEAVPMRVRLVLMLPDPADKEFLYTPAQRKRRSKEGTYLAWEQACRSRWRGLALLVKAKLEAVEIGISTFEEEFMPYIVIPGGGTLGQRILPDLERALETGEVEPMLALPVGRDG